MAGAADGDLPPGPRRRPRVVARNRATRRLSREVIVDAAMTVLDANGLDALTMRNLADELRTGPASLYAYFDDKDDLVAAVLDRVTGEVEVPEQPDPRHWQEQVKDIARSIRATLNRHRDVGRAAMGSVPTGENTLRVADALVGVLLAGGVSEPVTGLAVDIVALYCTATAFEESMDSWSGSDEIATLEYQRQLLSFFANLPRERFPHLVALAGPLTGGNGDERFEFGLDMLVRGIASTVATP